MLVGGGLAWLGCTVWCGGVTFRFPSKVPLTPLSQICGKFHPPKRNFFLKT